MALEEEIDDKRQDIHTDSYPMSIGELVNVYQDGDLDIHPEFQRIYRWSEMQKSKLIESILLGIPMPSFFVAQRNDGIWDVVDGLQRLSTIFSFLGIYKDEDGETTDPLVLQATEYLPSLEGRTWGSGDDNEQGDQPGTGLSKDLQRAFKREKIDIKIIKKESGGDTKYELFQRLNTGGTNLSGQEIRNCLMIMLDGELYNWFSELANSDPFRACLPLTNKQISEAYHMEMALRYFVYKASTPETRRGYKDVGEYITNRMRDIFCDPDFDRTGEQANFTRLFSAFSGALGESSFKKYNVEKQRHEGPFSLLVFEALCLGAQNHMGEYDDAALGEKICASSIALSTQAGFLDIANSQTRGMERFPRLKNQGELLFQNED